MQIANGAGGFAGAQMPFVQPADAGLGATHALPFAANVNASLCFDSVDVQPPPAAAGGVSFTSGATL